MEEYQGPTCIAGDFNAIFDISEKSGGNQSLSQGNRAFAKWVGELGLVDLGHQGPAYTWSNKQAGSRLIAQVGSGIGHHLLDYPISQGSCLSLAAL